MVFPGTTPATDVCHWGHRPAGELIERWSQVDADLTGREAFDDDESPAARRLRRGNAGIARAIIQKSVPDVSATEYFKPSQLVDLIHQNTKSFGVFHPGYRAVHANGRFYAGTFAPTPQAKTLSRALHLQDDRAPVTSRFSFGSGNVDDAPNGVVAMATRFYLPDGTYSNLLRDTKKASHVNVTAQQVCLRSLWTMASH